MKYSNLVERLKGKRTSAWDIHHAAVEALSKGEDIIVLTVGDPDFPTPSPIIESAVSALRAGDTHYGTVNGREPLRAAIARRHVRMTGRPLNAEHVILTLGAQNGVFAASLCLLEPGDEVIVPEPLYLTYEACVRAAGATLVAVPVDRTRAFHLDCWAIEGAITERTKAIFFATPCNPTGVVIPRSDLERLAEIARRNDLWVLSDEVYADITFERDHVSIASLPDMAERCLTLGSLSKSHAMAGWRVGWTIGPVELVEHMGRLALAMHFGLPGFVQQAALTALENEEKFTEKIREIYRSRRNLVFERLSQVPGLRCVNPEAGMFMLIDVSGTGLDPESFSWKLFRAKGVSVIDASAFGDSARGFVRLGFVVDDERLTDACDRIESFVMSLGR